MKRRSRQIMDAASTIEGHYKLGPVISYHELALQVAEIINEPKPVTKGDADNFLLDLAESIRRNNQTNYAWRGK